MEGDSASGTVQLAYTSAEGEEGYPGMVDFAVTFRLDGPTLVCEMRGVPGPADADQPRQPQLLQPRRRRHGAGPRPLARRAGLHPGRRRADPDGRDPRRSRARRSTSARRARSATPTSTTTSSSIPAATRRKPSATLFCPRTDVMPGADHGRAGDPGLRRGADGDRGAGPRRPALRPLRRALPRGAALPGQPPPAGLAEHRPHARGALLPAARGGDRPAPAEHRPPRRPTARSARVSTPFTRGVSARRGRTNATESTRHFGHRERRTTRSSYRDVNSPLWVMLSNTKSMVSRR